VGGTVVTALAGITVLDLTSGVAGPWCTALLAGFGAEVVKIEGPAGDPTRAAGPWPAGAPDPEASGLFLHLNRGKRSVCLDLEQEAGRALLERLLDRVDVLVSDHSPAAAERLDLADVTVRHPRLVHTWLTPFGTEGPYRDHAATDLVHSALAGWTATQGEPDREPLFVGSSIPSHLAGQHAALGTVLAVLDAEESGRGQRVDVSVQAVAATSLLYDSVGYAYTGHVRGRRGNRWDAPWKTLPVRDGWVGVTTIREWEVFWMVVLGTDDVPVNPSGLADPAERAAAIAALYERSRTVDKRAFFEAAQDLRVLACEVLELDEVLAAPHFAERGYFTTVEHPKAGAVVHTGPPARLPASPWGPAGPAPLLGEDTAAVLAGLGLDAADLERLRAAGVVAS
jgi:crotonobetainyl-CoA:carnitine CoA-transferase CaiB-like acyl-CoA transferase